MKLIIFLVYGFLVGWIMADCKKRFGHETFFLALGFLFVTATFAAFKYWRIL